MSLTSASPDGGNAAAPPAGAAPSQSITVANDAIGSVLVAGNDNDVRITLVVADHRLIDRRSIAEKAVGSVENPFRGLEAFREEDAEWFFGRSALVRRAWVKFEELQRGTAPRILAVLGASGSGKSSLVRAGLLPELAREPMRELRNPRVLVLRPGSAPMRSLAEVLAGLPGAPAAEAPLGQDRTEPPDALHAVVRALPDADKSRLIIVVDQFEELYNECEDTEAREVFLDNLAYAASQADRLVSVVLTLRSDFAGAVKTPAAFATAVRDNRLMVPAMSREELRDAISRPAHALGHPWPPALVENLVAQAEGRAGALPLLQFALKRLWPEHRKGSLDEASWTSRLIEDFLVQAAEELFEQAGAVVAERSSNHLIIRRAFLTMVQFGEGAADTRRAARLGEFVAHGENADLVQKALEPFTAPANRLVTASFSEEEHEPTYELSHEALIGSWDRLRNWLGQLPDKAESKRIRSELRFRRRLSFAAAEWRAGKADVWRPPELDRLLEYCSDAGDDLTADERAFVVSSKRAWRSERLRTRLSLVAAVLLPVAVVTAIILIRKNQIHQTEALKQGLRGAALLSLQQAEAGNGMAAILLALEAWRDDPDSPGRPLAREAELALYAAVHENREERVLRHPGDGATVTSVAFSADGSQILTASTDGRVRLWNAGGGDVTELPNWEAGAVATVAMVPGGGSGEPVFAASAEEPEAALWRSGRSGGPLVLQGHQGRIRDASFSPDGTLLATASADGTAILWDARTADLLRVLSAKDGGAVESAVVSQDLARVSTTSEDGKARLWDARAGEPIRSLEEEDEHVVASSFTKDDTAAITVSRDGTLRLWDRATGALIDKIPFRKLMVPGAPGAEVRRVQFSASRSLLVAAFSDGAAHVWRTENGQAIGLPLQETEGQIGFTAFSADDKLVATVATADEAIAGASAARPVRIWAVETGRLVATLRGHSQAVRAVAFSPDRTRLATGSEDNTARLWDARESRSDATVQGYRRRLRDPKLTPTEQIPLTPEQRRIALGLDDRPLAFSGDGRQLIAASDDQGLLVWDVAERTARRVLDVRQDGGHVSALAAHPARGFQVVSGGLDGELRLLDLRKPNAAVPLARHADAVSDIRYSGDGRRFITASWDGTARLWSSEEAAQLLHTLTGHGGPVLSAAFSPDGRLAATAAADGTARIWDAMLGLQRGVFEHEHRNVVSVSFDPGGQRLLTASWDGTARLWSTEPAALQSAPSPGKPLMEYRHDGLVRSAIFDPDGRFIVTVCDDGAAHLWHAGSGRKLGRLERQSGAAILAAAFLPAALHGVGDRIDDRFVVTAAADGTVEIWAGAIRVAELEGHRGAVTAVTFDSAAGRMATASADRTLRLWPVLPTGRALVDKARERKTRDLRAEERTRFFLPPEPPPRGK